MNVNFMSEPVDLLRQAVWTKNIKRSMLRQMIGVVSQPGITSFAGGLPDPLLFPRQALMQAAQSVLETDMLALQYRRPFEPLKEHIVQLMSKRGVDCTAQDVFITTGAQQGLDILTRFLLDRGGDVLLEELVYTGIQQVVSSLEPNILTVSTDLETGISVDEVEAHLLLGKRPAYIYVIPEAHNPLGVSLSLEKRHALVKLAEQYEIPIIEDDPYGFLQYETERLPTLYELNSDWVFYVGSFSKILAPGLRLGWILVPERYWPKLTVIKEAIDLETSAFTQRIVSSYLDEGLLPDHIELLCARYGERAHLMADGITDHFPEKVSWSRPRGGMFIWVALPEDVDSLALLHRAIEEVQVAFIPGIAFAIDGRSAAHCIRLNFSNCQPEMIVNGMERLGHLLKSVIY